MGFIYVAKGDKDSHFKIGLTRKNPLNRLKAHRTANPTIDYVLLMPCSDPAAVETGLHNHFESKRVASTTEWFRLLPDDLNFIKLFVERYEAIELPRRETLEELKKTKSSTVFLPFQEGDLAKHKRLRRLTRLQARIEQAKEKIENDLKLRIGADAGIEGFFSWGSFDKEYFDKRALAKTHPGLIAEYTTQVTQRRFVLLDLPD